MSKEEEKTDEESRIKVYITYKDKSVLFSANPKNSLKVTMENMRKLANTYPDKYWDLPEIGNEGQRFTYLLGKSENKTIFNFRNNNGEEQSLEKYGVKAGDYLKIIRKETGG